MRHFCQFHNDKNVQSVYERTNIKSRVEFEYLIFAVL
jgi:hypothetical protein